MPRKSKTAKIVRIAAEQLNTCYYCAREFSWDAWHLVTLDHKTPKCRGGSNRRENLVAACVKCNGMKGVLNEEEFWQCFVEASAKTEALLRKKWPLGEWTWRDEFYRGRFVACMGGLCKSRHIKILHGITAAAGVKTATPIPWPPKVESHSTRESRWPARMFDVIHQIGV